MHYVNFFRIKARFINSRTFEFGYSREIAKGNAYNAICYGDNWNGRHGTGYLRTITFQDNLGDFYDPSKNYKGIVIYEKQIDRGEDITRIIQYTDDFFLPINEKEFDEFIEAEKYHLNEIEQ